MLILIKYQFHNIIYVKAGRMIIGMQYYQELVSVMKGDLNPDEYSRSFYIAAVTPIGKGKTAKEAQKKKAQEEVIALPLK